MTKKEFVEKYKEIAGLESKAAADRLVGAFMECVENAMVEGEEVNFIGWGKFEVSERPARMGRNPQTGKEIKIEAKKIVKFKPGKKLNDKVN